MQITRLYHAVLIDIEISDAIYGNTTAYIFDDIVEYSSEYQGYLFSIDVTFEGKHSHLFIPEYTILKTGEYYLTFTVPKRYDVKLSTSIKHIICGYLDEVSDTWQSDGCKVSASATNMTSTVCLCNHLTSFSPRDYTDNTELNV
ncbi:polycystin-1-like protein 3 [Ptychodera flava]|uniref:polycystin-1-like protein 3 n=1 Tax=Ptychodera flava TaxID=63121 RepID=UPI00396A7355